MDNRRLLTTMILALGLFFVLQFLFPKKEKEVNKEQTAVAQQFYHPTGNPRQFYSLGSLDPNTDQAMMVTLDTRGASVRRIEMVQRDENGRFIIRELEDKSGYLGYLELRTDRKPGAVIRCLPTGSPLQQAQATLNDTGTSPSIGDRLISIDGNAIESDKDLQVFLADSKPGQSVEVLLARLKAGAEDDSSLDELMDLGEPTSEAPANSSNTTESEAAESKTTESSSDSADNETASDETTAGESKSGTSAESEAAKAEGETEASSETSASPTSASATAPESLSDAWQTYKVTVELMPRPKKTLGPEYKNTKNWTGVYPGTLEFTLQSANRVNWTDLDKAMRLDNWQATTGQDERGQYVRFTYDLPAKALDVLIDQSIKLGEKVDAAAEEAAAKKQAEEAAAGDDASVAAGDSEEDLKPGIRVTKTFRLPKLTPAQLNDPYADGYHLDMEVELTNLTDEAWDLGYRLNGPVATSIEGWWYQVKSHGGTWKLFYGAGARDVLVSTEETPYTFYGRPQITQDNKPFPIISADDSQEGRNINYVALDTHYFNSALMPIDVEGNTSQDFICYSGYASAAGTPPKKDRESQTKADTTFRLYKKLSLDANNGTYRQTFRLFSGPKRPELLEKYGVENAVTYGWFGLFSRPLLWLLHGFYAIVGNYGLAIVMLTILVKLIVMPMSRKALANAQMMQLLQPEIKKISEQYKDDMAQKQLATQQLWKKVNYNPLSGCILMPLQIPIFIGLYRGLSVDYALRDQPLIPGIEWCSNLAGPDQFLNWSAYLPAFIAGETGFLGPYLNILPLIAVGFFIVQQRMFTPPAMDEQQEMMQKTMSFMMIIMAFMFFKVPAGLCVYIITSSVWSLIERTMIPKPQLPQNIVDNINRELGNSGTVVDGKVVSSTSGGATKMDDEAKRELKEREKDRKRRLRERGRDS